MSNEKLDNILRSFDQSQNLYHDFAGAVNHLISTLLLDKSIQVHSVTHRCKSRASLEKKISRPEKNYAILSDITDLAAVRITTYFSDDVDRIASLIGDEFSVDPSDSVDKRVFDEPDRFGYLSLHYVATLGEARAGLSEYRRFSKIKFEIQIRSILQHAWAEIEHDLGYKSSVGVPASVRRRFARVAGLLELADDEFLAIRQTLGIYERELPASINRNPFSVDLDLTSLRALFDTESHAKKLDSIVANSSGIRLIESVGDSVDEADVRRLRFFGLETVGQLEQVAQKEAETVAKYVKYWLRNKGGTISPGIGLFYLGYVLAWKTSDGKRIADYVQALRIGKVNERLAIVNRILAFSED